MQATIQAAEHRSQATIQAAEHRSQALETQLLHAETEKLRNQEELIRMAPLLEQKEVERTRGIAAG
ncbi:hypothetical protein T484DRAFT_1849330 [Baffinella frigidus]|nr:hypothetical protein T484DRAFT_1849330 [Cryptophyta sp. CCMP2293]